MALLMASMFSRWLPMASTATTGVLLSTGAMASMFAESPRHWLDLMVAMLPMAPLVADAPPDILGLLVVMLFAEAPQDLQDLLIVMPVTMLPMALKLPMAPTGVMAAHGCRWLPLAAAVCRRLPTARAACAGLLMAAEAAAGFRGRRRRHG